MNFIFDLGILAFLLFMGYRLSFIQKEKTQLKEKLASNYNEEDANKLKFMSFFQIAMFLLWLGLFSYFLYFAISHFK